MNDGSRGRIPSETKKKVQSEIAKYGRASAWHYFAYTVAWGAMSTWDRQMMRAFDSLKRRSNNNA